MNEDENSDIEFNYDLDDVDTLSAKMSIEEIFEHTAAEVDQRKPASQPFRSLQANQRNLEHLLGLKDESITIGRVTNKGELTEEEAKLREHQAGPCHQVYKYIRNDITTWVSVIFRAYICY